MDCTQQLFSDIYANIDFKNIKQYNGIIIKSTVNMEPRKRYKATVLYFIPHQSNVNFMPQLFLT